MFPECLRMFPECSLKTCECSLESTAVVAEAVEMNAGSTDYSQPIISQTAEATRDVVVKVRAPSDQSQPLSRNIPRHPTNYSPSEGIFHTIRPITAPQREYSTPSDQSQPLIRNIPHLLLIDGGAVDVLSFAIEHGLAGIYEREGFVPVQVRLFEDGAEGCQIQRNYLPREQ